jgi:hypothetical protein
MSNYSEVMKEFDSYEIYTNKLQVKAEEKRKESLKKDFLVKLGGCFDKIKFLETFEKSNCEEIYYNKDELGEELLHTKKLTIQRWIFFILMIFLLFVLYISIFSLPFALIEVIIAFELYKIVYISFLLVLIPIFYFMVLATISNRFCSYNSRTFKEFIKKNFPILVFPFNKLSTDQIAIHFILGTKGLFIYSEFNTGYLNNIYTYKKLSEDKHIYNNAFTKLLSTNCKKKFFKLIQKYYG